MAMEIGQIQDVMLLYTMHYLFSNKKKKGYLKFSQLNVSSLRRGHANLLCIVPNLNSVTNTEVEGHGFSTNMVFI